MTILMSPKTHESTQGECLRIYYAEAVHCRHRASQVLLPFCWRNVSIETAFFFRRWSFLAGVTRLSSTANFHRTLQHSESEFPSMKRPWVRSPTRNWHCMHWPVLRPSVKCSGGAGLQSGHVCEDKVHKQDVGENSGCHCMDSHNVGPLGGAV